MQEVSDISKKDYFVWTTLLVVLNIIVILPLGLGSMSYTVGFWDFVFVLVGIYFCSKFVRYVSSAHEYPEARLKPRLMEEMVTKGIYQNIRHPIGSGTLYLNIGLILLLRSVALITVVPVFFVLWFLLAKYRDDKMLSRFGDKYRTYMESAGMFRSFGSSDQRLKDTGYEMY